MVQLWFELDAKTEDITVLYCASLRERIKVLHLTTDFEVVTSL